MGSLSPILSTGSGLLGLHLLNRLVRTEGKLKKLSQCFPVHLPLPPGTFTFVFSPI